MGDGGFSRINLLSRNDAIAVARRCDVPPQKVGATPSSRDQSNPPFGWAAGDWRRGIAGTCCDGGVAATRTAALLFNRIIPTWIVEQPSPDSPGTAH